MRKSDYEGMFAVGLAVILSWAVASPARAQTSEPAALVGQVSSVEEGLMEGVLVRASRPDSTIAVTVTSDASGRYSFPRNRLQPGRYFLNTRAVGYDLEDPGPVEIAAGRATQLALKLRKAQSVALQLSDAEWLWSMPGTREQKFTLYRCTRCHRLDRVVMSRHNADEWENVLKRMDTYGQATPMKPQHHGTLTPEQRATVDSHHAERIRVRGFQVEAEREFRVGRRELAEWLSTVNLSKGSTWAYAFKTHARPKGRETRAIITEYSLPRKETMVHDADYNSDDGMVWYTDFGSQFLGKLDPKSGEVVEYPIPVAKPGFEHGSNDVRFDRDGNAWVGNMSQGQLVKFDKKTQKVQAFPFPAEVNISPNIAMVMPYHAHVDGKVWTNNTSYNAIMRYDVNTGDWDTVYIYDKWTRDAFDHGVYGINSDAENNLFVFNVQGNTLIRVDAKTLDVKYYETPTPQSGPRRGRFDSEYRLWVALSEVDKVAMFDPKTERFREWDAPDPMAQTYDIMSDEQGSVWYGGTTSDFVYRLNPETGQQARYLLPKIHTNIRRVDVDTAETGRPIFWVGDNHGAAIYKLEPLD